MADRASSSTPRVVAVDSTACFLPTPACPALAHCRPTQPCSLHCRSQVGAGGNAGNQSAIKVIRGLATGTMKPTGGWHAQTAARRSGTGCGALMLGWSYSIHSTGQRMHSKRFQTQGTTGMVPGLRCGILVPC